MSTRALIEQWQGELCELRESLFSQALTQDNTLEYALLATEALRLSQCINQAWASMESDE